MSRMLFAHPYFGAFFMLILSFVIFGLIVKLSSIIGNKFANQNDERLKSAIYESGPESVKQPNQMNSNFFEGKGSMSAIFPSVIKPQNSGLYS